MSEQAIQSFRLKRVTFFHRNVMILCQNKNGPCPLIAITNILLLKGRLTLSTDLSYISLDEVIHLVAEIILEENEKLKANHAAASINQTFDDILQILPKLAQGLDLNICFHGVNKFEFTQEISIFDVLQIPLLHGWLYDSRIDELVSIIGDKSYNHLIYKMVDYKTLVDKLHNNSKELDKPVDVLVSELSPEEKDLYHEGFMLDNFMTESASQLTEIGLLKLYEFMQDRQLGVFFRNNHFSTMFSYNGQLFLLMTDLGYSDQEAVVWELLMNVNGSSEFYTSDFELVTEALIRETGEGISDTTVIPTTVQGTVAHPPSKAAPKPSPVLEETESPLHAASHQESAAASQVPQSSIPPSSPAVKLLPPAYDSNEVDSDMILAMQLQMEEERLRLEEEQQEKLKRQNSSRSKSSQPVPVSSPSQQPQQQPPVSSSRSPPSASSASSNRVTSSNPPLSEVTIAGGGNDLGMSQEEMDQQYAMMLHYQEMKQSQQYQQRHPQQQQQHQRVAAPATVQSGRPASTNNTSNKGSNCIIQ